MNFYLIVPALLIAANAAPIDTVSGTSTSNSSAVALGPEAYATTSPLFNASSVLQASMFHNTTNSTRFLNYTGSKKTVTDQYSLGCELSRIDYASVGMTDRFKSPDFSKKGKTLTGFWSVSNWVNYNLMESVLSGMANYPDYTIYNDDFEIKYKFTSDFVQTTQDIENVFEKYTYEGNTDEMAWKAALALGAYNFELSGGATRDYWLNKATDIFDNKLTKQWDSDKGGIHRDSKYRSASATELYFTLASQLYSLGAGDKYYDIAVNTWNWLSSSPLRTNKGLFYDGLDKNNKPTKDIYTANQGIVLSGLGYMYKITGDQYYVDEGLKIVDAVIDEMTENYVLYESCDLQVVNDISKKSKKIKYCSDDASYYKGVFMKHLNSFLGNIPSSNLDSLRDFVQANADAAWAAAEPDNGFHNIWVDENVWKDSTFSYLVDSSTGEAFDAFVTAIDFGYSC